MILDYLEHIMPGKNSIDACIIDISCVGSV